MRVLPSIFKGQGNINPMTKEERYLWWKTTTGGYNVSEERNREIFERDMRIFGYNEIDKAVQGRSSGESKSEVSISINITLK